MGFSLKRALQGAVMGVAHEAGEVFDGMIAEERKQREAVAAQERAFEVARYQADLTLDRERARDRDKEALSAKAEEKIKTEMKGYYTAAREAGFDPNKIDGMRFIAAKALEDGKAGIYDKITDNIDKREKNLADAENRKLQIEATRAQRELANAQREANKNEKLGEAYKMGMKDYDSVLDGFKVSTKDDAGNTQEDTTYKNWLKINTSGIAKQDPYAARDTALQLGMQLNEIKHNNPNLKPFEVVQKAEQIIRDQRASKKGAEFNADLGQRKTQFQGFDNVINPAPTEAPTTVPAPVQQPARTGEKTLGDVFMPSDRYGILQGWSNLKGPGGPSGRGR
jgi:hypothetical protein